MNELVRMLEIQYNDSLETLKNVVRLCPDTLWAADNDGLPIWNQVIHSLMGSDFWLRTDYESEFISCLPIPENVREQLWSEEWCSNGSFMTKAQVTDCFDALEKKKSEFFALLTDEMLSRKILPDMKFTYLSVICAQIRHIMCHSGMCAAAITAAGGEELPWIAFGEN